MRLRHGLLVTVALLTAFALVLPASAQADRIYFEAKGDGPIAGSGPERFWETPNHEHARDWHGVYSTAMTEGPMPEIYTGMEYVTASWNLNPTTLNGSMWGTAHLVLTHLDGGYKGTWVAKWRGEGCWTAKGVGNGYGAVAGYTVKYDLLCDGSVSGYIVMPGGN